MDDNLKLINFREALISVGRRGPDSAKWPIPAGMAGKAFLDTFATDFFKSLEKALQKGVSYKQIASSFKTPSRLWKISHHLLKGLQRSNLPVEYQRKAILSLLDLIENIKDKDLFNSSDNNFFLSKTHISDVLKDTNLSIPQNNASLKVHYLSALLWSYTESLYFSEHGLGKEYHGSYEAKQNDTFTFIRDFFNLRPTFFFNQTKNLSFDSIRIITIYNKNMEICLDVYNNILSHGSPIKTLSSYSVIADGQSLDIDEIDTVCKSIEKLLKEIVSTIDGWSVTQKALRFGEIFWLCKKPLCDLINQDWKLPNSLRERILRESFDELSQTSSLSYEEIFKRLTSPLIGQ